MKRLAVRRALALLWLVVSLAGCRPAETTLPDSPVTSTPPAAASTEMPQDDVIPTEIIQADSSLPVFPPIPWSLETITAGNAARVAPLTLVGEGIFGDHIQASPDGSLLAVTTTGGVLLVDAADGTRLQFLHMPAAVDSLAFSPDGTHLAVTHREPGEDFYTSDERAGLPIYHPVLTIYDLTADAPVLIVNLAGRGCGQYDAWDLAYAPDGQTIIFRDFYSLLGHDRTDNICLVSAVDGELIHSIPLDDGWQSASPPHFSPDGQHIFIAVKEQMTADISNPGTRVETYAVGTGERVQQFDGGAWVQVMALSPDGQQVALAGASGASLFSTENGLPISSFGNPDQEVIALAFSPDGARLAIGSQDGTVSLWEASSGTLVWQTQRWLHDTPLDSMNEGSGIWDLAFTADGQTLFALEPTHFIGVSGQVIVLSALDGQQQYRLHDTNMLITPSVSPDLSRVVFGGFEDGHATVWSTVQDQPLFDLLGHARMVTAVDFSPAGDRIATASLDGEVRLWNADDGASLATMSGHSGPVRAIRFSPDGAWLASVGDDAVLNLWDAQTGALFKPVDAQTGNSLANFLAFSPGGGSVLLASACIYADLCSTRGDGDLRRIDLQTGQIEVLLPYSVLSISFSADQLLFGLEGVQGIQTGQVIGGQYQPQASYRSPLGNGALSGEAVTPDGQLFISGNGFGLHIWNISSGEQLALNTGTTQPYGNIHVSPDQKIITVAQMNGLVSLWGVPAGQP